MQTIEACRIALHERPIVVLADEVDSDAIDMAIGLGVCGVIPTHLASDVAMAAIQLILAGGRYYPDSAWPRRSASISVDRHGTSGAARGEASMRFAPGRAADGPMRLPDDEDLLAPRSNAQPDGTIDERCVEVHINGRSLVLTARQVDVIRLLEQGLSNKAIAKALDLSESTVKLHVRHLLRKLKVSNRTQIALLALSMEREPLAP
ncbi:response regulator transcription factor [Rubellimicrobium roseum]|uniref:Response regulator transcription factor n=2 Tax=Rubellimicrobium roseum TaxID=687525 RepID=A0A5C4NPP0_9RHOB|nr:response regulator transcription factor [Rubellimicrobium roseum]